MVRGLRFYFLRIPITHFLNPGNPNYPFHIQLEAAYSDLKRCIC